MLNSVHQERGKLRRTGIVAVKAGMTQVFEEGGLLLSAATVLKVEENIVLDVRTQEKHGYDAVVLGVGKKKRMNSPARGIARKAGVESFRLQREFRVHDSCLLDIGTVVPLTHFVVGQYVDVTGITIGKGFQGAMKRHHFAGLEASHGVSVTHRCHGSTGTRDSKVYKGRKMAGHMGNQRRTVKHLRIIDIDTAMGIIVVAGAVPGHNGATLLIRDSINKPLHPAAPLPTHLN